MRILVVGGGSGGHLTPALAILEALAEKDTQLEVLLVCDKKFAPQARIILAGSPVQVTLKTVAAGKLRRYHSVPLWRQLIDIPTIALNIRDLFLIGIGFVQSWWLLGRFKPAIVFAKGGFVCLPIGIAAQWRRIPLVIHDSDAHPGLTNRILARRATRIATGAPLENYPYDRTRSRYVGIPVGENFQPLAVVARSALKQQFMTEATRPLLVVTGGGLGAQRINQALLKSAQALIAAGVEIIHVAGAAHGQAVQQAITREVDPEMAKFYHIKAFVDPTEMAQLLQAADVVVSRGGATALAELAMLHKASIIIPNPRLTGGHQLKNAAVLAEAGAAIVLQEADLEDSAILQQSILMVASNNEQRQQFEQTMGRFAKPQAASDVAQMILEVAVQGSKG